MRHVTEQQKPNCLDFHFVNKWNVSLFPNIQVLNLNYAFFSFKN